jgi:hypothetical protein
VRLWRSYQFWFQKCWAYQGESNETYFCKICTDRLPKFTDSYFGETSFRSNDNVFNLTGSSLSSTHDENNETYDIFNELTEQRKKHPETFTCAYLNINSIRYKFCSIKQKSHWMAFWFDLTDFWHRVQGYFIGPGLICMSPLSKILNIRQYVDWLAIFLFPVMTFSGLSYVFSQISTTILKCMMSGQKTLAFTLVNWTLRRANVTTPSKNFVRVYSIHQTKMADLKKS